MPRKRTSGLPKRPKVVRKAPVSPSEPSNPLEAPPVRHPCADCGQEKEITDADHQAEAENHLWGDGLCAACRVRKAASCVPVSVGIAETLDAIRLAETDHLLTPHGYEVRSDDFDGWWEGLSAKGKERAREGAEERGITVRYLLNNWPHFREG